MIKTFRIRIRMDQAFIWKGIMRAAAKFASETQRVGISARMSSIALQTIFVRVSRLNQFMMAQ